MRLLDQTHGALGLLAANGSEPAGGAATGQVIGATAGALVATAAIGVVLAGHRSGRLSGLSRAARLASRVSGLPEWAALPSGVLGASLLTAVLGMYWDISLHIDNGRDPGPLANPAHYLILVGLFGALLAGVLTIALSPERPNATAVRLGPRAFAPLGGLVIVACGSFALTGFPLDDVWHRLFGQDVTLWGPTHLMLIGGGSLATLGAMVLMSEAVADLGREPRRGRAAADVRRALLVGGFLVALSTFQGEFDFGVPQFRILLEPVLIMLAAGIGLVAARVYIGRGGALYAVAGFIAIRGVVALVVGGVFGQTTPHFPLYVVEALVVELVIARVGTRRPVPAGALAGVAVGTAGLAAEWGWSQLAMPVPWTAELLPEAAVLGLITAVGAGAVGGFVGGALARPGAGPLPRGERLAALGGLVVVVLVVAYGVPLTTHGPRSARVALHEVRGGPQRTVTATIRVNPPDGLSHTELANVTAWQGGGSVVSSLERLGPGRYRTKTPFPVHGSWKAMLRVQRGNGLVSVPIYLPEDRAIPARAVPARPRFTRAFVLDRRNLQRERRRGVPASLSTAAYLTVLALAIALVTLLAGVLLRLARGGPARRARRTRAASPSRAAA
jgi:hypothetical protein